MTYEFFGCDVSTEKIAIVGIDKDGDFVAREVSSNTRGPRGGKRKDILSLVDEFCREIEALSSRDSIIGIEGLPWVKNRQGIVSFGMVLGAMRYGLHLIGRQSMLVEGSKWKKGIGLAGNANKDAISAWVRVNCPDIKALEEIASQDIMDAYAIARHVKGSNK